MLMAYNLNMQEKRNITNPDSLFMTNGHVMHPNLETNQSKRIGSLLDQTSPKVAFERPP